MPVMSLEDFHITIHEKVNAGHIMCIAGVREDSVQGVIINQVTFEDLVVQLIQKIDDLSRGEYFEFSPTFDSNLYGFCKGHEELVE